MSESSAGWLVVNTHPHKEAVAITNLNNQGYGTYCPVVRRRVRHARKTSDVLRPLFPGYVFVECFKDKAGWRAAASTYGVRALITAGDEPSRLDDRFIAALRAREEDGVIVAPISPYEVGQKVRIASGPFDGTVATIVGLGEKERLVVLMDILSRPVRVSVDARQVAGS